MPQNLSFTNIEFIDFTWLPNTFGIAGGFTAPLNCKEKSNIELIYENMTILNSE